MSSGKQSGKVRIGTSGYQYDHWKGLFYPPGLPKRDWFGHYARLFDTVEINNTFYRLPEATTFQAWAAAAPAGFLYALKFSRYGTHIKRLREPEEPIRSFLERAELLGELLGPILVQLPPHWKVNQARLARFLEAAPCGHRWAIEFRDPSWLIEEIFALLEAQNAALCIHDLIPNHPRRITADWVYLRFHGQHHGGAYSHQYLSAQARQIAHYRAQGLDVFAYFNNDVGGHAVRNAADLKHYLANP
jgi:uncharacterized protein YecE (DUF72 family)